MPGFKITEHQTNGPSPGNVPAPELTTYTYTWDVSKLIGTNFATSANMIYLKTATPPTYNIESENVDTGHANYQFAKGIKWNDIKLTFYDTKGLAAWLQPKVLNVGSNIGPPTAWNAGQTQQSGIRPADEYMATTRLDVYYYDQTYAYGWILANSWIKSVSVSELTYESSGVNNVSVTVAFAWATITYTVNGD